MDWQNRMSTKLGKGKRLKKKIKHAEIQIDNFWKSRQTQAPLPPLSGLGLLGRSGGQRKGLATPALIYNDIKGDDKEENRLQLLISITQTQPSFMGWGESWKYNKSLPPKEEGSAATSKWGKCWMFATQQSHSEAGNPWVNGPNLVDPHTLYLWNKPDYRVAELQKLDIHLPGEEWKMSW